MPATRSDIPPRHPSQVPNMKRRYRNAPVLQDDPDIIILSSDDDKPSRPSKSAPTKKTSRQREKAPVVIPFGDILEITSEEEGGSSPEETSTNTSMAELQNTVKRLEKENSKLRQDSTEARRELLELRAARNADRRKLDLDTSQLEDIISCEICALKMWNPYTLGCGHTFCQSCLEDWFSTTLAQHMTAYPNYTANPPVPAHIRGFPAHVQQQARLQIAHMQPPPPPYTCPTCRQAVKNQPAEAFAMKAMVRTIANAMGETSPRKAAPPRRNGLIVAREGPWDGFFPKPMIR